MFTITLLMYYPEELQDYTNYSSQLIQDCMFLAIRLPFWQRRSKPYEA